jgi:WASH complex subunit strumpellin
MAFIDGNNLCGQTLLRLSSRGSSLIAELFRLSNNIPSVYAEQNSKNPSLEQQLLFNFNYLKRPEYYERKINASEALQIADDEMQDTNDELLVRFYNFFEGIVKYVTDIKQYFDDLEEGVFLQHDIETVLLDADGKQLVCEVFYLLGTILIFLDLRIPGIIREQLIVGHYRSHGESQVTNFDQVCKLMRSTGYVKGDRKATPKTYPQDYFSRLSLDHDLLNMVINRLSSDDIYLQTRTFPDPSHRSTALANQASMLYVILYFIPDILMSNKHKMREIVDRHFNDNWIIALYMGVDVDLSVEWKQYKAATEALKNTLDLENVNHTKNENTRILIKCEKDLAKYLTEGVLNENYVLDHIPPLMNCLRRCNVTLRWLLLHRRTKDKKIYDIVVNQGVPTERIVTLLLNTAQLEYKLKTVLNGIMDTKEQRWNECRASVAERLNELSNYFTGQMALTRVEADDNLKTWFSNLAQDVTSFEFGDSMQAGNVAGRKIQNTIAALQDLERYEAIDTSLQIKQFLSETCGLLTQMIRVVNVTDTIVARLATVSDLSYAWEIVNDYIGSFHERVRRDPRSVVLLRATFLKLVSILDVPLTRVLASGSPDFESVADYYSGELVALVRRVLEVIPVSIFRILREIIKILSHDLAPLPLKLEVVRLKDASQLDKREQLAKHTHRISVFAEGILAMEETKLGMIEVNPREILEDGIRKELVRTMSDVMQRGLIFQDGKKVLSTEKQLKTIATQLQGFKSAFEYIQDYVSIYGLKMWQEEFSRIVSFNVEQECNIFLKKKVIPQHSIYWRRAIPIPMYPSVERGTSNFMGRLCNALLRITDYRATVYACESLGWYTADGTETAGIKLFTYLNSSVGVAGLSGVDRLLSFRIVHYLNTFLQKFYRSSVTPFIAQLQRIDSDLAPHFVIPSKNPPKFYKQCISKLQKLWNPMTNYVLGIGQAQLLRRQISHELQFSCHLDSNLLAHALSNLNKSLILDLHSHYSSPETKNAPDKENPLLEETSKMSEATGSHNPMRQIYVTSEPLENIATLLFLLVVTCLPKLAYDTNLVALVRRKGSDGIDGGPLVAGIATILKQFHPCQTLKFFGHLG